MTSRFSKPLVLVDVDGPLNPWKLITKKGYLPLKPRPDDPEPFTYEKYLFRVGEWEDPDGPPLPVLLSPDHGRALRELSQVFQIVWATTWAHEANRLLSPVLGLPADLPVIEWPEATSTNRISHRRSWKTSHILRWLDENAIGPDGKVLAWSWVDDELTTRDRAAVREHYGYARGETPTVPNQLMRIEPTRGLRREDFDDLARFGESAARLINAASTTTHQPDPSADE